MTSQISQHFFTHSPLNFLLDSASTTLALLKYLYFFVHLCQGWPTTARGQKSASQDIFKCPLKFFEKIKFVKKVMRILHQLIEKLILAGLEIAFDMV